MKKIFILPLLILCGCVSQTIEKIQSDPENIQKAVSVQKRVNTGMENNKDYKDCVNNVKTLTALKNKKSLSRDDMNKILDINSDFGEWHRDSQWQKVYDDITRCEFDHKYKNLPLEQEIENFCAEKYWRGNWATAITLFPLRMTNELVAIGTLGIVPTILGTCRANGRGWESDDTTFFPEWCWKPGATWNYETCRKFIVGDNHKLGNNQFAIEDNYWQYTNTDKKYEFNEQDIEKLLSKMDQFCKEPTNFNPYANKLCDGDYTKKGCLVDLGRYSVATFGTRSNGVIVEFNSWLIQGGYPKFVYDSRDYYDGQDLKTGGYYYQYVGNHEDGIQKLPAFKRSQYKVFEEPNTDVERWCNQKNPNR